MNSRIILGLILALCVFLRFYHLGSCGLWSDEFVTLMIVSANSCGQLIRTCFEVPQPVPPFYFLVNKLVFDWFPAAEAGLRLLSAGASVVTGYLLFAVGRTLFNAEAGLWAALLFAVNSTQIVYAQNARPYALCLMLSTLSMLYFLRWLDSPTWPSRVGYLIASTLLFYTHYVFFPLVLIQTLYFAWATSRRPTRAASLSRWKEWLLLQGTVGCALLPLASQLTQVISARQSLNWESRLPKTVGDFLVFFHRRALWMGIATWVLLSLVMRATKRSRKDPVLSMRSACENRRAPALVLLGLWYVLPIILFFVLLQALGINLFVERYLTLASLATFVLLPVMALSFDVAWAGRGALLAYFVSYIWLVPVTLLRHRGEFSPGVPGGNEWRETLVQLDKPDFQASLFLFQSPFIESNRLDFAESPKLRDYLSTPLRSFYVRKPDQPFVLLPVHWWIKTPDHLKFKAAIRTQLTAHHEFVLLSTQEFWDYFEPWLQREFPEQCGWKVVRSFRSSGALRLRRVGHIQEPGCTTRARQPGAT
jgi:hypothetical protein